MDGEYLVCSGGWEGGGAVSDGDGGLGGVGSAAVGSQECDGVGSGLGVSDGGLW